MRRAAASFPLTLLLLVAAVSSAQAHFNMLLPQTAAAKRGEPITLRYQWGHPFEHEVFDAPMPESLFVVAPDGTKTDLTKSLAKVSLRASDGKSVTGYQLRFTPEQRGDHVFFLSTPPIWMEEEMHFLQDTVKVVLHVQTQNGWDAEASGTAFELVPLTRPYGLLAGSVFQARIVPRKSSAGTAALVEIERYNPAPPKDLPPDEHVTRTARTDPNGVVTCTLHEPGWWGITAQRDGDTLERNGKKFLLRRRATFWVLVDDKPVPKPGK